MKKPWPAVVGLGLAAALTVGASNAAEIKVISSNGVTAIMRELGPRFEQATGHKLDIRFGAAALLRKELEAGATFDVAILTVPHVEALTAQGKLVAGSSVNIARSGIGVANRAGAPKPDISTTDAFRQTMLAAKSVAYGSDGSSGQNFVRVLERLGIAEEMKPKARVRQSGSGGSTGQLVVKGEAELAVQQISELLPVAGIQLVGPFPPELQVYTTFTGALGPATRDRAAARALLSFLSAPEALPVIRSKGME